MNPTVCCLMLVNGRPEMVKRAIRCFQAQTYKNKILHQLENEGGRTIGTLRNFLNERVLVYEKPDIFIHWDSDDWSHPNRIAEQVALLQASGKACVGYRDMLFYDETPGHFCSAWMYQNNDPRYCLGTSLCYWRKTWEARPFPDLPKAKGGTGEDTEWLREVDSQGFSSFGPDIVIPSRVVGASDGYSPRMVASIHGSNTQYYDPSTYVEQKMGTSWKRAAEWDHYCQERMKL